MPPRDPDAEERALSAAMCAPDDWGDPAAEVLAVLPPDRGDWFADDYNKVVFGAICSLVENNETVTHLAVCYLLKQWGMIDRAGGEDHLREIAHRAVSGADAKCAAERVREVAIRRRLWLAAEASKRDADNQSKTLADVLEGHQQRMATVTDSLPDAPGPGWATIAEIGKGEQYNSGLTPITTGYSVLDRALGGGFRPECLYPLAGRTGSAKSTLALSMARREALAGHSVLFLKLEESMIEAVYRLHAATAQVRLRVLLNGAEGAGGADQERLADAWDILQQLPIRLADSRDIEAIERISQKHVADGGRIIFVDQLSMVQVPDTTIGYERATAVSNRLRLLARDLHVPIVVVCQVNRPASKMDGHLSCHDLRDSGAIENDAAAVLLIDRARDPDGPQYAGSDPMKYLQIIVGKNRYGACTDPEKPIELLWHPAIARIDDADLGGGGQ